MTCPSSMIVLSVRIADLADLSCSRQAQGAAVWLLPNWLAALEDRAIARFLGHKASVNMPEVSNAKDQRRATVQQTKASILTHLNQQYYPITSRRLAYELGIPPMRLRPVLAAMVAEGSIEIVGHHNGNGNPARLYVAN